MKNDSPPKCIAAGSLGARYRVDNFTVPSHSRSRFLAAVARNLEFLATLPGFVSHTVLERTEGPSRFDIATIAIWESQEAVEAAKERVSAYYRTIGFDPRAAMIDWGVSAELGFFRQLEISVAAADPTESPENS